MFGNLTEDVASVLKFSQSYPFDINVGNLMQQWQWGKSPLFPKFPSFVNKSQSRISVKLNEEQRATKFNDFLVALEKQHLLPSSFRSFLLRNQDSFFENEVSRGDESLKINPGTKLSRTFRKFFPDDFSTRRAQDIASQYIQLNAIEGYMNISIHPLDYLTISENNENWRTCQALDGEFRSGILNYLTDSVTLVAYLAEDTMEHLQCLPEGMFWNSKKWRMLIHINDNAVYFDKQYPFHSKELFDEAFNLLSSIFPSLLYFTEKKNYGVNLCFSEKSIPQTLHHSNLYAGGRVFDITDIVDFKISGYSDLLYSPMYAPECIVNKALFKQVYLPSITKDFLSEYYAMKKCFGMEIGKLGYCVKCGSNKVTTKNTFLCDECYEGKDYYPSCDECHRRFYRGAEVLNYNFTKKVCRNCYKALIEEDELTLKNAEEE